MSEVHVQEIWRTYPRLLRYCKIRPKPMLMLTVQKNGSFGWNDHREEIIRGYARLKREVENPFGLHVHHSRGRAFAPYEYQYDLINYGRSLLGEIGISVDDHTSGWSQNNEDTVRACCDARIMNFHHHESRPIKLLEGMRSVPYRKFIHDFQITEKRLIAMEAKL